MSFHKIDIEFLVKRFEERHRRGLGCIAALLNGNEDCVQALNSAYSEIDRLVELNKVLNARNEQLLGDVDKTVEMQTAIAQRDVVIESLKSQLDAEKISHLRNVEEGGKQWGAAVERCQDLERENGYLKTDNARLQRDVKALSSCNDKLHEELQKLGGDATANQQWIPPASLVEGDYLWLRDGWLYNAHGTPVILGRFARESFSDWTDPPRIGRWRKYGPPGSLAKYLGQ